METIMECTWNTEIVKLRPEQVGIDHTFLVFIWL